MDDEDDGIVHVCPAARPTKDFSSHLPSFSEYVLHMLDLDATDAFQSAAAQAVQTAAGYYLFLRISEENLIERIHSALLPLGQSAAQLLLREFRQRRAEYFSRHWERMEEMIEVNRDEYGRWKAGVNASVHQEESRSVLELMTSAQLDSVVGDGAAVLIVTSPFCSWCRLVVPLVTEQLKSVQISVFVVDSRSTELIDSRLRMKNVFPQLVVWQNKSARGTLALSSVESVNNIKLWLQQINFVSLEGPLTGIWRQSIDANELLKLKQELATQRRDVSAKMALKALGRCCNQSNSDSVRPPVAVLLGGGIASGKTSLVAALNELKDWSGRDAVVIEADLFKMADPLFHTVMRRSGPGDATRVVHRESTEAAEELLLTAVERGADIVLDGTSKWAPFVLQTIQMLRLAHVRKTRRGPGYQNPDNEIYWIQEELREEPRQPYQIWFIASSCATNVAVGRSIRRGILDGRWSSLSELLRSHKLFSTNFELYSKHVDLAILYENTRSRPLESPPPMLAKRERGGELLVYDAEAFDRFQKQQFIRTTAVSAAGLFGGDEQGTISPVSAAPPTSGLRDLLLMLAILN